MTHRVRNAPVDEQLSSGEQCYTERTCPRSSWSGREGNKEQHFRIEGLKNKGHPTKSAEDLLTVLSQTRDLLRAYIERTTTSDNPPPETP